MDSTNGRRQPTLHDYKQLKFVRRIESKYHFGAILGQGAFGTVRLCKQIATGKTFAIKIMQKKAIEVYHKRSFEKFLITQTFSYNRFRV